MAPTEQNALAVAEEYQAEPTEAADAALMAPETFDLEAAIEAFISQLDRSPQTRSTYRRSLRAWKRYITDRGVLPLQATRQTVIDFKEYTASTSKASTVNAYLTAVRRFYRWLESLRIYPNVAADVQGLKRSRYQAKDSLTKEQARHLLDKEPQTLKDLRNYAILSLMLRAGLRTIEVARADYGDIRQENGGLVLYVQGKGYTDKGDYIVLTDAAAGPIFRYLDARKAAGETLKDETPLFASVSNRNHGGRMSTRSVSRIIKSAYEAEGISSARLTAHSLRHTAVTFALKAGASLQAAQAMARHQSINTTMIYAHNLDRMETAAERNVEAYLAS